MSKPVIVLTVAVIVVAWVALSVNDLRGGSEAALATATATAARPLAPVMPTVAYAELLHNIDVYTGQAVYYEGRVSRIVEQSATGVVMLVEVTRSGYSAWDDTLYVTANRAPESEFIRLWGTVRGDASHAGLLGQSVTLPEIAATVIVPGEE